MTRPTWDETWLKLAQDMALRSRCSRDQVGAVIVDPSNRIVATAYNGPPANWPDDGACREFCPRAQYGPTPETALSYTDCVSLHAEANALLVCDRVAREGGTIYTTSGVCQGCAKLIANSGLARVVVPYDENVDHLHRDLDASYDLLEMCGVSVVFHT